MTNLPRTSTILAQLRGPVTTTGLGKVEGNTVEDGDSGMDDGSMMTGNDSGVDFSRTVDMVKFSET